MPEVVFLIIGIILGFVFGWYWIERKFRDAMAEDKSAFDERMRQSMAEISSANEDNKELRDRLIELQLQHQECAPEMLKLRGRISELEQSVESTAAQSKESVGDDKVVIDEGKLASSSEETQSAARIAELELQLSQERERRQVLRGEFERIEQQLARSSLGAVQLGGESLALHEASAPFKHEDPIVGDAADKPSDQDSATQTAAPMGIMSGVQADDSEPLFPTTDDVAVDDLKRIKGIGPVLERKLHKLGVKSFAQIAAFTDDDIGKVDQVLNFKGRIEREDWVGQARNLA